MNYFADIETYSVKYFQQHKNIKGYAFLLLSEDYKTEIFDTDGLTWLKQLFTLKGVKSHKKNSPEKLNIFFHNGGNFDLHFLLPFIHDLSIKEELTYSYFISDKKSIYSIEIQINNKIITFKDTAKLIPSRLEELGDIIKLPKMDYGDYDITTQFTNESFKEYGNGKAYEYLYRDVEILIEFNKLLKQKDILIEKMELTLAGTAYKEWKKLTSDSLTNQISNGFTNKKTQEQMYIKYNTKDWATLKRGYRGGFTYVNPRFQLKEIHNIKKYDVNSLYPSVMYNNSFPVGKLYEGNQMFASWKFIQVVIKQVSTKGVPFIEALDGEEGHEYNYPKTLTNVVKYMDNIMFNLFKKYYTGKYTFKILYSAVERKDIFKTYIDKYMDLKIQAEKDGNPALRMYAKLMLNSVYGKFGQKINDISIKITNELPSTHLNINGNLWNVNENGSRTKITKNNNIYYIIENNGTIEETSFKYLPIAIKITSLARAQLVEAINNNYDNFVYCDTDSIHLLEEAKEIHINKYDLGAWKYEGEVKTGVYRRAKHYLNLNVVEEDKTTPYILKGGGFNVKNFNETKEITLQQYLQKDFVVIDGKLAKTFVDGGVLLFSIPYKFGMPKWYVGEENE